MSFHSTKSFSSTISQLLFKTIFSNWVYLNYSKSKSSHLWFFIISNPNSQNNYLSWIVHSHMGIFQLVLETWKLGMEELNNYCCKVVKNLHKDLIHLTSLIYLDISRCESLEKVPSGIYTLKALEELIFGGCKPLWKMCEELGGGWHASRNWTCQFDDLNPIQGFQPTTNYSRMCISISKENITHILCVQNLMT